ncbi:MAG: GHKL domain-containing protein [Bacteroidetes bacterium]|nr:GHKL domain-containing protein [Bacteroidota bacterium]
MSFLCITFALASDTLGINAMSNIKPDTAQINKLLEQGIQAIKTNASSERIITVLSKANELSRQINYDFGKGRANYLLGKYYLSQANYPAAMENFTVASILFRNLNDKKYFALTQMQLGIVLYTQKQWSEALPYFETGARDLLIIGDTLNSATCNYLSGLASFEDKDYSNGEKMLKQALKEFETINNTQRVMEARLGLANLYLEVKNKNLALNNLDTCKLYLLGNPQKDVEAMCNLFYGKAALLDNDYERAESYYSLAYKSASELNNLTLMLKITKPIAELYKLIKKYDKALLFQEEYYKIQDSIFTLHNSRAIASLQNMNKLEKQKSEILLLNKKLEVDKVVRIALIAVAIMLVLYAFNWYYKTKRIKIAYTKLSESNAELALALSNLKSAQDQLLHSEKMASLGRLTAGIAHEIKNPLNFVINFSSVSKELIDDFTASNDEDEKKDLLIDVKSNIDKIYYHGTRADKIMQNMLQHSRTGTGQRKLTDLNKLCDDYLEFTYQSMRANNPNYKCTLVRSLQMDLPEVRLEPQDISRVLLNLLNNAMYAVANRNDPRVEIKTSVINNAVRIEIKDNGPGIPEEIKQKIFEPFFTTKPTGEGTGLGLSICYDIVVAHKGSIVADSVEGAYTNFIIELPVLKT